MSRVVHCLLRLLSIQKPPSRYRSCYNRIEHTGRYYWVILQRSLTSIECDRLWSMYCMIAIIASGGKIDTKHLYLLTTLALAHVALDIAVGRVMVEGRMWVEFDWVP